MEVERVRIVRVRRKDIVETLREILSLRPGTANSDVNVFDIPCEVPLGVLYRCLDEIERLRKPVGYGGVRHE